MAPMFLDDSLRDLAGSRVPGVAVVIVGAAGIRMRAATGVADLASGTPMTTDTAVPWFSMTKLATATTVMRLAARGLLPLDAPVLPLVPAMSCLRPASWAKRITARHLMQHTAGLANPIPLRWVHPPDQPGPDPLEFLHNQLSKHPRLRFEPGTKGQLLQSGSAGPGRSDHPGGRYPLPGRGRPGSPATDWDDPHLLLLPPKYATGHR